MKRLTAGPWPAPAVRCRYMRMMIAVAALVMGAAFLGFSVMCALTRRRGDARQLFFASIIYLPALLGAMVIDRV